MKAGIFKITPDKERAKSMMKMAETTLEMLKDINQKKFPSNVLKEYYDVIRELISIILYSDGFKTKGDGAHKLLIEYLEKNYKQFTKYEILLLEDLRKTRNKITYDGFFITDDYLQRKKKDILALISKLKYIAHKKLKEK